jgi:hypothetical protein
MWLELGPTCIPHSTPHTYTKKERGKYFASTKEVVAMMALGKHHSINNNDGEGTLKVVDGASQPQP